VFANAVLHWVLPLKAAVEGIRRALKPGGRLVAELGGKGNIAAVLDAVSSSRDEVGAPSATTAGNAFFFPTAEEYTSMLEEHGFSVATADPFGRPTPMDGSADGMRHWLDALGDGLSDDVRT
jgi:SAM-dependent methyltransferase